ncbi:MAG: helicase C-terminal domain-containing protein [Thermoproteus sp.]
MRILLQAPPGFGKSRRLAKIAVEHGGPAVFFVRSHMEAFQIYSYIASYGGTASLMFGRSALCKFGAKTVAECSALREKGICKARYKYIDRRFAKIEEIYDSGVCPYEYLQALGRQSKITVLPLSYLESQEYLSSIADLLRDAELIVVDEAHNLLLHDLAVEKDLPSTRLCDESLRKCLLLPVVGRLLGGRDVVLASASITRPFSDMFIELLNIKYINRDNIFFDNLIIDIYPVEIRYKNRMKKYVVDLIREIIQSIFKSNKVIVFVPNKELFEYYKRRLKGLPLSDRPLGDLPHIVLTYFGSPLAEGLNIDVDAAVLIGFPLPNIKDPWLKSKMRLIGELGYNGFKYVLLFSAISNSIQAMGRAMRDLEKKEKYIVAVDDRFWRYRWAMPQWFYSSATLRETPKR